jgi:ABC-type multidrug transport system fused ATPase/permease subunit
MELAKQDLEAIARSRAGRSKVMLVVMGVGLLWLIGAIVTLFTIDMFMDFMTWAEIVMVGFVVWYIAYTILNEVKARKLMDRIKEEYENTKS